jgi:hypothetical protein
VNFDTDFHVEISAINSQIYSKEFWYDDTVLNEWSMKMGSHDTPAQAAAGITGTAVGLS